MVRTASNPDSPRTMTDVLAQLRDMTLAGAAVGEPAYVALIRLLTMGGRIPYQAGVDALIPRDLAVLSQVLGDETIRLEPPGGKPHSDDLLVCQSVQGRLFLAEHPADPDDGPAVAAPIARLSLSEPMLERVAEEVLSWEITEQAEQAELDLMLRGWADQGVLPDRIRQVADWVERVETVLVYIGDLTYSRSDAGTSTLSRDGWLARLESSPLYTWSAADRLFVAAAHLLFATGRSIRFEEFNGRQLSATRLRTWLVATWRRYAYATATPVPPRLAARPLDTLAEEVRELSDTVNRSDWVRFRRIVGPTFAKTEVLAELPVDRRSHKTLPEPIRGFAVQVTGTAPDDKLPAEAAVATIVDALLTRPVDEGGAALAQLLATIVHAAVVDLRADYAMSSAVRDIRRLAPSGGSRVAGILELRKPDFFCCVLPHPQLLEQRIEADIGRILWLVAQRMQYNRWHFAPGNFDRAEIPLRRHYFFPPALPDLAESSDLWHGGHVAAQVRYSVRAPGAQLWRQALDVSGNAHRGCFDIRAVRMSGEPFGREQLWTAIRYSGLVDALWRQVAEWVRRERPVPTIPGFDRNWYEHAGWKAPQQAYGYGVVDQLR